MATELAMAMRRLKAQEALVQQMADLNRKMDLVMARLGIEGKDPAAVVEPKADEVPATETSEPKESDEVPATADVETEDK
ncbi:MAG: hypothetical protein HY865_22160 [Chloroflexi bacterium]|nr:hypothetical protein [Chloroflexota bacterium]